MTRTKVGHIDWGFTCNRVWSGVEDEKSNQFYTRLFKHICIYTDIFIFYLKKKHTYVCDDLSCAVFTCNNQEIRKFD